MFRRQPAEVAGDLISTTPGAPLMFRPTVVQTPAIFTISILIWRFLRGIVRLVYRHPIALLIPATLGVIAYWFGWRWSVSLLCFTVSGLCLWFLVDRASFSRWVGWRLLAFWRLGWIYRRSWSFALSGAGLSKSGRGGLEYRPYLLRLVCDSVCDVVTVKMLKGQSFDEWAAKSDNLAHAFGAQSCRVSIVRAGVLRLRFARRDPLAKPFGAIAIPALVDLLALPIGLREDGKMWTLRVAGTHILCAGATGAGKGSILWAIVRALLPAIKAGYVRLWGLDPKMMELAYGREIFYKYGATGDECADLLEEMVSCMQDRAALFGGHQRSHTASLEYPLDLAIIDEAAFLTAYQRDRQLRERINAAMATLSTQGRAVGYGLLAFLQDPRKEVMGIRSLFPDKIAMRLDAPAEVDMVLGDGARERGALADQISPIPSVGAGVAYIRLETNPEPIRVRATYVDDTDIREMVAWLHEGTAHDGDTLTFPPIETSGERS